ncbi:MAG: hypothetical protein RIQ53_3998 [Pseudomonadota bacterium]|jgi:hypothetical protein
MSAAVADWEVGCLVNDQAENFDRERFLLARVYRLTPAVVLHFVSRIATHAAARYVDKHARILASQIVWFQGARNSIESEPGRASIDPDDVLRTKLDEMEGGLRKLQDQTARLARLMDRSSGHDGNPFAASLRRLDVTIAHLADEVRALKGSVQAHDANVDAMDHASRAVARSTQALDEHLDSALSR